MNAAEDTVVNEISSVILAKKKYRNILPGLVHRLVQTEISKGRMGKALIKAVTSKLHQVAGAYFPAQPNYHAWESALQNLPKDLESPVVKAFCRRLMEKHASTYERLGILEDFFHKTLSSISPVRSILDLACGFNPLALPWMPVADNFHYSGCDVYMDMVHFLDKFAAYYCLDANFYPCDLQAMDFKGKYQVAFLLKSLACLDQLEKGISTSLLEEIPAEYLLVSYPVRSLGGSQKGMRVFYADQIESFLDLRGWEFEKHEFMDELAYLVKKA